MEAWSNSEHDVSSLGREGTSDDDGCAYSTLRKTICALEKDGSGKPVQRCEKIVERLRKCPGRPQEVVDSKVEVTEEDASASQGSMYLRYDSGAGNNYAAPHYWQGRGSPAYGALPGGEHPLGGHLGRNGPNQAPLERFMQDLFGGSFGSSEEFQTAHPPVTDGRGAEGPLSWFLGGTFGGRSQRAPAAGSSERSDSQQRADFYEALAKGIQEV